MPNIYVPRTFGGTIILLNGTLTNRDIAVRLNAAISQDTFNRSSTSGSSTIMSANGWGTAASDGRTWAGTGGGSPSYQIVTNGSLQMGQITGSTSANIKLLGSISQANAGAIVTVAFSSTSDEGGLILRYPSSGNQYRFKYTGAGHFAIAKNVGGTVTGLVSSTFTITANTLYTIRAQVIGTALYGKIWATSSPEPTSWTLTAVDSAQTVGQFGVYCVLNATSDTAQFANFAAYDTSSVTRDTPSRTLLAALVKRDVPSRVVLTTTPLRSLASRLIQAAARLRDVKARFILTSAIPTRDMVLRLILSKLRNSDVTARFPMAFSQDSFNRPGTAGSTTSSAVAGWGVATNPNTTSEGETWNGFGGGATFQIVTNGGNQVGQITGATNNIVRQLGPKNILNVGAVVQVAFSSTSDEGGLILRSVSGGNHYRFRYAGNGHFAIARDVNGTVLSLASTPFTLTAGSFYSIRAQAIGSYLCAKIWLAGTLEPANWMLTTTDSTQSVGQFGVYCNLAATTDTAQFLGFAAYDAPATSRDISLRLELLATALNDIINVRLILGTLTSWNLSSRLYLVPPLIPIPLVRDMGVRLNLTPAPGNVQLGASGIQNNTFMVGLDLPMIRPSTPYQVNGVPLPDNPTMATAPMASGNTIPAGASFTLLFANPTSATQTAFTSTATQTITVGAGGSGYALRAFASTLSGLSTDGIQSVSTSGARVTLTFALANGQMVTGLVEVSTSLIGSLFQVQVTLVQNLVINTRVVSTQFF